MKIAIINGPNLNLLGERQPEVYGSSTLKDLESQLRTAFPEHEFDFFQNNDEGRLIDYVQRCRKSAAAIILNPGAYSHTSIGLADALAAVTIPVVEVHISNIHSREVFRLRSLTAPHTKGIISGFGLKGYEMAVNSLVM
mgnify:CR=1 FL=1